MKCDVDIRKDLYANTVLSGGTTMFPGIASYAEGNLLPRPTHHEDQDHRTTREEILRLDRRIYLGFALHLPTDVDQQTRIRRIWPIHRSPKMLLDDFLCIVCNKLLKLRRVL